MKLTIIHFTRDFRSDKPQLGGYSRILNLCRDNNFHYVFTFSFSNSELRDYVLEGNITVVEVPYLSKNFRLRHQLINMRTTVDFILNYIRKNNLEIDVIFGHSQLINFFILNRVKEQIGQKPIIWEMNAIWGHRDAKGFSDKLLLRLYSLVQHYVLLKSNYIIAHTKESQKYVISNFGISPDKIAVLTNAVVKHEIRDENIVNSTQVNIEKRFICLGFFDEMNGIPFIVDYLGRKEEKMDVVFFGSGKYESQVIELAKMGKCKYGGNLKRKDMIKKLSEFTYVIIPRLPQKEADLFIPTKLIEAMANGVIPICSDVKGMTEVVTDNHDGYLFHAGNMADLDRVIIKALKNTQENINEMRKNAINTVREKYSWENNHLILQHIYTKVIGNAD
jgi:glycosyltransferase involved in cell wall biosynthesis